MNRKREKSESFLCSQPKTYSRRTTRTSSSVCKSHHDISCPLEIFKWSSSSEDFNSLEGNLFGIISNLVFPKSKLMLHILTQTLQRQGLLQTDGRRDWVGEKRLVFCSVCKKLMRKPCTGIGPGYKHLLQRGKSSQTDYSSDIQENVILMEAKYRVKA